VSSIAKIRQAKLLSCWSYLIIAEQNYLDRPLAMQALYDERP
jgi:hypothetical protein